MFPLNKPYIPSRSKEYVLESLESDHQHGDGPFAKRVTALLSALHGDAEVFLTPSCTDSLEIASILADLGPGDEVIIPSFNFSSGALAIEKFGARPVFIDIESESKCIDVKLIERAITDKTKAISWVNYAGNSPELRTLNAIAKERNLFLIEDNAHGLGGSYEGKTLGTFGDVSTLSFHATKNVQCGEGGAIVVNNSDLIERVNIIREKGTNRSSFVRGEVHRYQWVGRGSSYLMAETLAAVLLGQLEIFDEIQADRVKSWKRYDQMFRSYPMKSLKLNDNQFLRNVNVAHNYYLELENQRSRDDLMNTLQGKGIYSAFHYQPLHQSPAGKNFFTGEYGLPVTERVSETLLRTPLYFNLEDELWPKLEEVLSDFYKR